MRHINFRPLILVIPGSLIVLMVMSTAEDAGKKYGLLAEKAALIGLNDQQLNLVRYLKEAEAHHEYDIIETIKLCQAANVSTSHDCTMPNGTTVKDEIASRQWSTAN